jgi:hypothetical protein
MHDSHKKLKPNNNGESVQCNHLPSELIRCILVYYGLPFHTLFLRYFQQTSKQEVVELNVYNRLVKMLFGYHLNHDRQVFLVFPSISMDEVTILPFLEKYKDLAHLLAQSVIRMKDLVSIYSCNWFHDEIKILPTQKLDNLRSVIMEYHRECSFDEVIMSSSKNIGTVKVSNTAIEDYSKFVNLKTLNFLIHTSDTLLLENLILPESITDLQIPYRFCELAMKLPKLKALGVYGDELSEEILLVDIFKLTSLTSLFIESCACTLKLSFENLASLPLIKFSTWNDMPVEYYQYLEQNTSIRHLNMGRLPNGYLNNRFIQQLNSLECRRADSQDIARIIEFGINLKYLSISWKYHIIKLREQLEHLQLAGITFGTVQAIPITLRRLELTSTTIDDDWIVKLSTHETFIQELVLLRKSPAKSFSTTFIQELELRRRSPTESFSTKAVAALFSMKSLSELKISGIIAPELLVNAKLRKLNLVMKDTDYKNWKTIIREIYLASSHIPDFGIDRQGIPSSCDSLKLQLLRTNYSKDQIFYVFVI